jgi:hypothetical protein
MAIVATDIKWPLSGGSSNTDPNAALGGAASSTEIVDATSDNLFDDVSGAEATAGDVEYRGFYVKNGHATLALSNTKIYISSLTSSASTEFDIGLATEATNTTMATIANESTAPSGVTFSRPTDYTGGLAIGTLNAGDRKGVWIRRTVTAGASPASDAGTLKVEGDTPP